MFYQFLVLFLYNQFFLLVRLCFFLLHSINYNDLISLIKTLEIFFNIKPHLKVDDRH